MPLWLIVKRYQIRMLVNGLYTLQALGRLVAGCVESESCPACTWTSPKTLKVKPSAKGPTFCQIHLNQCHTVSEPACSLHWNSSFSALLYILCVTSFSICIHNIYIYIWFLQYATALMPFHILIKTWRPPEICIKSTQFLVNNQGWFQGLQ